MSQDLKLIGEYLKAVVRHWIALVIGFGLTGLDFIERVGATWYQPPLWARITTAIAGLSFAQYMAYRELKIRSASADEVRAKQEQLAAALQQGRALQWEARTNPATTTPEFSKWASQFDDWIRKIHDLLGNQFGKLAAETFLNDAGLRDVSHIGVPVDYHLRLTLLNRRLENLHKIAQNFTSAERAGA